MIATYQKSFNGMFVEEIFLSQSITLENFKQKCFSKEDFKWFFY